jgi:hypothetical protein
MCSTLESGPVGKKRDAANTSLADWQKSLDTGPKANLCRSRNAALLPRAFFEHAPVPTFNTPTRHAIVPKQVTQCREFHDRRSASTVHLMNHLKESIMNPKQIAVAVSLLASAAAAMAVEATQWNPPAGQRTRAEVKAELAQAAASGELEANRGEAYAGFIDKNVPQSNLSRAEVKQELARARANGELEGRTEAYGGFPEAHRDVSGNAFAAWRKRHRAAHGAGE